MIRQYRLKCVTLLINMDYLPTLHQKSQMLYRQACEGYSKGLGHGPLASAVDEKIHYSLWIFGQEANIIFYISYSVATLATAIDFRCWLTNDVSQKEIPHSIFLVQFRNVPFQKLSAISRNKMSFQKFTRKKKRISILEKC